jgi:hypothetical protein
MIATDIWGWEDAAPVSSNERQIDKVLDSLRQARDDFLVIAEAAIKNADEATATIDRLIKRM